MPRSLGIGRYEAALRENAITVDFTPGTPTWGFGVPPMLLKPTWRMMAENGVAGRARAALDSRARLSAKLSRF